MTLFLISVGALCFFCGLFVGGFQQWLEIRRDERLESSVPDIPCPPPPPPIRLSFETGGALGPRFLATLNTLEIKPHSLILLQFEDKMPPGQHLRRLVESLLGKLPRDINMLVMDKHSQIIVTEEIQVPPTMETLA